MRILPHLGHTEEDSFGYTTVMRKLGLLIIIALLALPIFSSGFLSTLAYAPSGYFAFSHYADELPMRTSMAHTVSVEPLGYQHGPISASTHLHYRAVTPSIPWGSYQARGFTSIGVGARLAYHLTPRFAITAEGGIQYNWYNAIEWAFISFWAGTGIEYSIYQNPNSDLAIILPITVDLRKEVTGITIGLGARWSFDPALGGW